MGLRGVVVSIYPSTGYVGVIFDGDFIGGKRLSKVCNAHLTSCSHPVNTISYTASTSFVHAHVHTGISLLSVIF
jgi:hypothetical protein